MATDLPEDREESSSLESAVPIGDPIFYLPTHTIPVRFISFVHDCAVMSEADAKRSVDRLNQAIGGQMIVGASFVKFAFYRYDHIPIGPQRRKDVTTIDDMAPFAEAMGISRAKMRELAQYMTNWDQDERFLFRWLNAYRRFLMPDQVVVWQGCDGGVELSTSAFVSGVGNVVHELGHGFNLSHTFGISPTCDAYDLVYAARGTGKSNVYFKSKAECDEFEATNTGYTLTRLDVSRGGPAGSGRECSGKVVTLHHPRCPNCEVETYRTGDWQIAGYSKRLADGTSVINALAYTSSSCSSAEFFSQSQMQRMEDYWTDTVPWVFKQGKPASVAAPAEGCSWIQAGEGLKVGESFPSCNGRYHLNLQRDGNLVIYDGDKAIWATGLLGTTDSAGRDTTGTDHTDLTLKMNSNGKLSIYDNHPYEIFSVDTSGNPGAYLKLTDRGGLEIRDSATKVIWSRNNPTFTDSTCSTGILSDNVCCAASCGTCGGTGCDKRPGGGAACCGNPILKAGVSCSGSAPPCVVD